MKSSSLVHLENNVLFQSLEVSAREFRDSLIHNFYIPRKYTELLNVFLLRRGIPEDVISRINNYGELSLGEQDYSVVWMQSPNKIFKSEFAVCSFRYCNLLRCGYVLIREWKDEDEEKNIEDISWSD